MNGPRNQILEALAIACTDAPDPHPGHSFFNSPIPRQVCEKWLKGRRGRPRTQANVLSYRRMVVVLEETFRLTAEIDRVIKTHGGWPCAFKGMGS